MKLLGALLLLLFGVLVTALCCGAETGFYAFSRLRHRLEVERGTSAARRLDRLLARPDRVLAALLIGTNLALATVTFCTQMVLEEWVSLSISARATVGAAVMTPLLFVFAEALPKHVFLTRPYPMLVLTSWPLTLLVGLLSPVAGLIAWLGAKLEKWAPVGEADHAAMPTGSIGVEGVLQHGLREGLLTRSEHMLAANVLRMGSMTASDVAVPLDRLPHLRKSEAGPAWAKSLAKQPDTRALVVDDATGAVVGMVHALDLAFALAEERPLVEGVVRALPTLHPKLTLAEALSRLHEEAATLALVTSGKGRTTRLLRLQDVVEELIGPLHA